MAINNSDRLCQIFAQPIQGNLSCRRHPSDLWWQRDSCGVTVKLGWTGSSRGMITELPRSTSPSFGRRIAVVYRSVIKKRVGLALPASLAFPNISIGMTPRQRGLLFGSHARQLLCAI